MYDDVFRDGNKSAMVRLIYLNNSKHAKDMVGFSVQKPKKQFTTDGL